MKNTGCAKERALYVGGNLNNASSSGLQTWNSNNPASNANWNIVSRSILYAPSHTFLCASLALAKIHDYLSLCVGRIFRTLREDISL